MTPTGQTTRGEQTAHADQVTRSEHLNWAKERALAYLDAGDAGQAWNSMISDLGKHEGTRDHLGIELGGQLILAGQMNNRQLREWIEGFN